MKNILYLIMFAVGFGVLFPLQANVRKDVSLAIGQTKTIVGSKIRTKFVEVTEDSRCPEGTVCIWAGNAKIKLTLSKNGKRSQTVDLETNGPNKSVTFEGYIISIKSLVPTPKAGSETNAKLYRAVLNVEKTK